MLNKALKSLYIVYSWLTLILGFFFHFLTATMLMWFFKDRQHAHRIITTPFIRITFFVNGIRLRVMGDENLPKTGAYILMCNHLSLLDILALMAAIPIRFFFVAKEELSQIPILNWDLKLQGHILLERDNPRKAIRQLDDISEFVKAGNSILIFPEGTRSVNGELQPFKQGAFTIAERTNFQVIPIAIQGTDRIVRKKEFRAYPGPIDVAIGKPLTLNWDHAKSKKKRYREVMDQVQHEMVALRLHLESRSIPK